MTQRDVKTFRILAMASTGALITLGFGYAALRNAPLADTLAVVTKAAVSRVTGMFSDRMIETFALVVAVFILEIIFVGWTSSSVFRLSLRRSRSAIIDAFYFLYVLMRLSSFVEILFTFGFSLVMSRLVTWVSSQYGWTRITLPTDGVFQIAIGFAVYWLAFTFFGYWGHRLVHLPIFWHLHRFHHAATELNMVTAFRQHPVEPVVLGLLGVVSPLVFFNVSDQILFVAFLWGTTFDLLAHSQLKWGYGWFGRWVVASPMVHQVHHSIDAEHRDLHFSSCPLWDHLFGTWYQGKNLPSGFGVPERDYDERPLRQFALDAWNFYIGVMQWILSPLKSVRLSKAKTPPA